MSDFTGSQYGQFNIGLFQTCFTGQCILNRYGDTTDEVNLPPTFSKRLYNAAPLSIVGVFLQIVGCSLCFLTAFIYLPPKPSLMCYLAPFIMFFAFLLQFSTLAEASYGIHLNGRSSVVFETALVLEVIVIILIVVAADRIHEIGDVQYV